jgi:hypothetical protein
LDANGLIVAVLCGQPIDPTYQQELFRLFLNMRTIGEGLPLQEPHRRGDFQAFNFGVVMGMGTPQPVNLKSPSPAVFALFGHEGLRRMIGFQKGSCC